MKIRNELHVEQHVL